MWEGMLGTVYAYDGIEVRYFDYDWEAARKFAGVSDDRDPRIAKKTRRVRYTDSPYEPSVGKLVLWIKSQ